MCTIIVHNHVQAHDLEKVHLVYQQVSTLIYNPIFILYNLIIICNDNSNSMKLAEVIAKVIRSKCFFFAECRSQELSTSKDVSDHKEMISKLKKNDV